MLSIVFYLLIYIFETSKKNHYLMKKTHFSRKQRQLKYLVKKLNVLLQNREEFLKNEISKLTAKIKFLVSKLNGIVSVNKMKRLLGSLALFIGVSFANTASAQYFQPPVTNPFGIAPSANVSVSIPAVGDLDGDGDLDLLTQEYNDNSYTMDFQYSENIGNANAPQFSNSTTNPYNLVGDTVPRFHNLVDLDGDGDLDILSLDAEEVNDTINYNYGSVSHFRYYENIGTPTNPIFDTVVTNPFGLISDSSWAITDLADIDNDGDLDILMASNSWDYYSYTYYGYTYTFGTPPKFKFIENIGDANNPSFASPIDNLYGLVVPGMISSPSFSDYDNDGDLDLFVGAIDTSNYYNSVIHYFENTGTNTQAQFSAPLPNPFGLTSIMQFAMLEIADLDGDGDDDILAGEYYGNLMYFENDTTAPPPVTSWDCFVNVGCIDPGNGSGAYASLSDCQTACVTPVSWNCDATLGCVDPADGTGTYTDLSDCQTACNNVSVDDNNLINFNIYPNPIKDVLNIKSDKEIIKNEISDVLGKIILSEINPTNRINVERLKSGIYSIKTIFKDESSIIQKIVK